jgi:ribosomal protein L40E
MNSQQLYAQQTCPRCGGTFPKAQTFCPHCGYIKEESWWARLLEWFRPTPTAETAKPSSANFLSTLIGLVVAGFFLYRALEQNSLQSWLLAIVSLAIAIRAWFSARKGPEPTGGSEQGEVDLHPGEPVGEKEPASTPTTQHFFCENCGTEVAPDAIQCPKCGMEFGE